MDSGASDEEFFFFLSRFRQATNIMEWRDGERLLQNYERHLYRAFLSDWESILDSANDEAAVDAAGLPIHDVDFFEEVVANYTADQFDKADWTEQADYIRALKKPKSMSPKQFLSRLRHLVAVLAEFPQAPLENIFSEDELKRIYLKAHPKQWIDRFENAGKTASTVSMSKIKGYMEHQTKKEPIVPVARAKTNGNGNGNPNSRCRNNRNSRSNRNGNSNSGRTGCNSGQGNQQGRGQGARINSSDPCPLPGHGGHTWGNCNANAYNSSRRQSAPRESNQTERRGTTNADRPPARAPARRANPNSGSHTDAAPVRGTTFRDDAQAGYESYYTNISHEIYSDQPEAFYSGQELEPEQYEPWVPALPSTYVIMSL
jgi:hypothetical protein